MKKISTNLFLIVFLVITGCTQMPTEKQSVSDLRPQISFKADNSDIYNARVILDGLDVGSIGQYIDGKASLRILSGTHLIQVSIKDKIIFEEKFYSGDGVNRTFIVR